MPTRKQQPIEHRLLLTATFCLLAGGAVMVYSASSARTLLEGEGDGTAYLVKYLIYGGIGLVAMQVLSRHGLATIRRMTPILLIVAFALLVLVLLPGIGVRVNGARRWIGAGPLQFQPSEIMKLALVLHTAAVIAARPKIARSLRLVVVPVIGVAGIAVLLILGQPDLGTALVIAAILGACLFMSGASLRWLAVLAGAAAAAFPFIWTYVLQDYQKARLTAFLNPGADVQGAGFQLFQSQIAVGLGGWFGVGLTNGQQNAQGLLPVQDTDFVFAILAEELGFVGAMVVILLFVGLIWRVMVTGWRSKDPFGTIFACGVASWLLFQLVVNVGMVIGMMPITGIPLPFISHGGASLISIAIALGVLQSINIRQGRAEW
jgi:cell division protein FtsW